MTAYFIADQVEVTDLERMKAYAAGVMETVKRYGGRAVVRGGAFEVMEGTCTPKRVIVLEFPDIATLKRWYNSPEYAPLLEIRLASSRSSVVAVEGA